MEENSKFTTNKSNSRSSSFNTQKTISNEEYETYLWCHFRRKKEELERNHQLRLANIVTSQNVFSSPKTTSKKKKNTTFTKTYTKYQHEKNHSNSLYSSESNGISDDETVVTIISTTGVSQKSNKEVPLVDHSDSKSDYYSTGDSNVSTTLPNGNITFDVPKQVDLVTKKKIPYSVRWKFFLHNSKPNKAGRTLYWKCLGAYVCNHIACKFVESPRAPDTKNKNASPKPSTKKCVLHPHAQMVHQPCSCTMIVVDMGEFWRVKHIGQHNHAVPPMENRTLLPNSKIQLQKRILSSPESTSLDLKIGRNTRPSVHKIDPALSNIRRVERERNKCAPATNPVSSSLVHLIQFQKKNPGFIQEISVVSEPPFILLQDKAMLELLLDGRSPLQTDTVEGFVHEKSVIPKKEVNLTVTSGYDYTLKRWIPLLISILFGKTVHDYKVHFQYLLSLYKFRTWTDFQCRFPGNTSDFSDALKTAFYDTVKHLSLTKWKVHLENNNINPYYGYCNVHFKRSVSRVSRISSVVPPDRIDEFKGMIDQLFTFDEDHFDDFVTQCKDIQNRFPNVFPWLQWYLSPKRATVLFKACSLNKTKNGKFPKLTNNTNAQENVGRQVQQASLKKKVGVGEVIDICYRFCNMIYNDRRNIVQGLCNAPRNRKRRKKGVKSKNVNCMNKNQSKVSLNICCKRTIVRQKKKTKVFANDGRPPDTAEELVPSNPKFDNQGTFQGCNYSFLRKCDNAYVHNTCRLDCLLTIFFIWNQQQVSKGGISLLAALQMNHPLRQSFHYLENGDCSLAREVLTNVLFPSLDSYQDQYDVTNWYGHIGHCYKNVFKDVIGVKFLRTKICCKCKKHEYRKSGDTTYTLFTVNQQSKENPLGIFASLIEDLNCSKKHGNREKNHCVSGTKNCNGPSLTVNKQIVCCTNNLLVFEMSADEKNISVFDVPKNVTFDDKEFKLFAIICKSDCHFVSWIWFGDQWAFYDGMRRPTMKYVTENQKCSTFVRNIEKEYKFCSMIYELTKKPGSTIDLAGFESDSDADSEEDLLFPDLKAAKRASREMQEKNSHSKNNLNLYKVNSVRNKKKEKKNSHRKNKLPSYNVSRNVNGTILETLEEMCSKDARKVKVSGTERKRKNMEGNNSNNSKENFLSVSTLTDVDCVKKQNRFKFDSKKDFDFKSVDSNDPRLKKQRKVITNIEMIGKLVDDEAPCLPEKCDKELGKKEKKKSNDQQAKQQTAVIGKIWYAECLKTRIDDAVDRPSSCLSKDSEEEKEEEEQGEKEKIEQPRSCLSKDYKEEEAKEEETDRPRSCLSEDSEEEKVEEEGEDKINLELKDHPGSTRSNCKKVISKKVSRECLGLQSHMKSGKKWFEGITRKTRQRNQDKKK